jgi:serine/threonine protein phosphatase PrpC
MWTVSAGTITGPHHRRRGEANQDAVEVWHDDEQGWALVAVADGAGSLPRSGEGAARAVRVAAAAVTHHLKLGEATAST